MEKIKTPQLGQKWDTEVAEVVMQIWGGADRKRVIEIELGKHRVKELMRAYKKSK